MKRAACVLAVLLLVFAGGFSLVVPREAERRTPRGLNIERNDRTDNVFWLALSERWPVRTWGSLRERAVVQAQKLRRFAARSGGKLVLVRTAGELREYRDRRLRRGRRQGRPHAPGPGVGAEDGGAADDRRPRPRLAANPR